MKGGAGVKLATPIFLGYNFLFLGLVLAYIKKVRCKI